MIAPPFNSKFATAIRTAVLGLILLVACWRSASGASTYSAKTFPALADVLKRWDGLPLDAVEKAAGDGEITAQHYLGYCLAEAHRAARDPAKAIEWYTRAGDAGYMPSLSNLGVLYQHGKVVPRDFNKAIQYYRRAAEGGYVPSLRYLGYAYRDTDETSRDYAEAMRWFQKAADAGDVPAMTAIGRLYLFGNGVPRDLSKAKHWIERGMERGDDLARINMGLLFEAEGDPAKAFKLFEPMAQEGKADVMFKVYEMLRNGIGVEKNFAAAKSWLVRSAEAGHAPAQCTLGYLCDHPAPEDLSNPSRQRSLGAAVQWYQRAVDQGNLASHYYLGRLFLAGEGVEQDEQRGLELIRIAADKGNRTALWDLAELYERGVGAPRNSNETPLRIWQNLAEKEAASDEEYGYFRAQIAYEKVVFRLAEGIGAEVDWIAAARWYCRAAEAGLEPFSLTDPFLVRAKLGSGMTYGGSGDSRHAIQIRSGYRHKFSDEFLTFVVLYVRAANPVNSSTAERISDMCARGQRTPRSDIAACLWLKQAALSGSPDIVSRLSACESRLEPAEREELARLWPAFRRELETTSAEAGRNLKAPSR